MAPLYRVAILGDIHGNYPALQAVLDDVVQYRPDCIVLAGDLVMNCIYGKQVLEHIQALSAFSIMGNTDDEVLNSTDPVALWTRQQIGTAGCAYLQTLPTSVRVTPPGAPSLVNDLLVVHSTPRSYFDLLILAPHPLVTTFTAPTPASEVAVMLQDAPFHTMVYGHIHYASSARWQAQHLVSIGSVGFPFDGDQRAAYAVADWEEDAWSILHRRVSYDYERVAGEVQRSTLPFSARYAAMLRAANWLPRSAY